VTPNIRRGGGSEYLEGVVGVIFCKASFMFGGANINLHLASGNASLDCVVEHRLRDNQESPRGREDRRKVGIKHGVGFALLMDGVGQECGRGNRKGEILSIS